MPPQMDELLARVDQCSTQAHELSAHFEELRDQIRQAISIAQLDPEMSLARSRKVLEYIIRDIYDDALKPKRAGTQPLEGLVQTLVKEGQFPVRLAAYADMVRGLGNVGVHAFDKGVNSQDVLNSLSNLMPIVEWFFEHRKMPGADIPPVTAAARVSSAVPSSSAQRIAATTDVESPSLRKPDSQSSGVRPAAEPARAASRTSPPSGLRWTRVKLWAIGAVPVILAACGIWYVTHRHAAPEVITNSIGLKFTLIPAGEFMMGSPDNEPGAKAEEHPQHRVQITRPYYLGTYSVTRGQFARFVAATNYKTDAEKYGQGGTGYTREAKTPWDQRPEFTWRNTGFEQTDEHPVVNVSWNDAVAFCKWLSDQDGATYRLPTEAEWEFACRAGTRTAYFFGDNPRDLALYANTANATAKQNLPTFHPTVNAPVGFEFTAPVGSFRPNPLELYDMLGNAWQWCSDWYGSGYFLELQSADPQGPAAGSGHVMRGGSWVNSAARCRCSTRDYLQPATRSAHQVGFRVVRELGPPATAGQPVAQSTPSETSSKPPATVATPGDAGAKLPTITNSLGMQLTLIPAGEFLMGSPDNEPGAKAEEHPQHQVRISKPFYLGTYSVTRGQFAKFVAATNYQTDAEKSGKGGAGHDLISGGYIEQKPEFSWQNTGFPQTDEHPVVNVSWNDAVAFCQWLSREEKKTYRLPTEAEWEYACRAGTSTAYFFGDDPQAIAKYANVADATAKEKYPRWPAIQASDGYVFTAPVGSFRPNPFGLYDMLGNVWQWCADSYAADYYKNSPPADPPGPAAGARSERACRGGGFVNLPDTCRCASRAGVESAIRRDYVGFRVECEPNSPAVSIPPVNTPTPSDASAKLPTITNSLGMKLSLIPAGDFMMGSPEAEAGGRANEHPQHRVRISRPYYFGTYSVTRGEFAKFVAATNYKTLAETSGKGGFGFAGGTGTHAIVQKPEYNWRNTGFAQTDEHPVVNVSWADARAFCKWLSDQEGKSYRLPTEAEWEYACRAGTTTSYFFSDNPQDLAKHAQTYASPGYTVPVGSFPPNHFGLYDMLGNAWQWTADWYALDYFKLSAPADPTGPLEGTVRVARGGGWLNSPTQCRCAFRDAVDPAYFDCNIGFRVALEPEPAAPRNLPATAPAANNASTKLPTITNSIDMKLALIPAGEFMMGSPMDEPGALANEHPQHRVRLTKPFYLGTCAVTKAQFAKFIAATNNKTDAEKDGKGGWGYTGDKAIPYSQKPEFIWRNPGFPQTDDDPVVEVSWNDAVEFCKWLSGQEGATYRLPTEAEWEYACRAGTTTAYFFGDRPDELGNYAWYAANSTIGTHPVGRKLPNPWGLYDMQGNVWQRCADWYNAYYYKASPPADPLGPATGIGRIERGGSFGDTPATCRCSMRASFEPTLRSYNVGFRVARER